jgi:hypothetical protein
MVSDGSPSAARRLGVQPFSREMVQDHLERMELKFTTDDDGDFSVDFSLNDEEEIVLRVVMTAEGPNDDIFVIRGVTNLMVPKTLWPKVIAGCNQWNQERRYPKAYLFVPPDEDTLFGTIHLEGQFPLGAGVTQPLVDDLITTLVQTSFAFWQDAFEHKLLAEEELPETPND